MHVLHANPSQGTKSYFNQCIPTAKQEHYICKFLFITYKWHNRSALHAPPPASSGETHISRLALYMHRNIYHLWYCRLSSRLAISNLSGIKASSSMILIACLQKYAQCFYFAEASLFKKHVHDLTTKNMSIINFFKKNFKCKYCYVEIEIINNGIDGEGFYYIWTRLQF